jgi:NAD(P)-dependent dehydrogenase (short-subunit alcohol dehydrogenase family)
VNAARAIADTAGMHKQLSHLVAVSDGPNVSVRVIPFGAGPHAASSSGQFTNLEFPAAEVGELDLLINNAGILLRDDLTDPAAIERHLAVSLFGAYAVTQAYLPVLVRSRGAIGNILSRPSSTPSTTTRKDIFPDPMSALLRRRLARWSRQGAGAATRRGGARYAVGPRRVPDPDFVVTQSRRNRLR